MITAEQRADIKARIEATYKAKCEAEELHVWDAANRHWREHVKLLEVQRGRREYFPADPATYGQI